MTNDFPLRASKKSIGADTFLPSSEKEVENVFHMIRPSPLEIPGAFHIEGPAVEVLVVANSQIDAAPLMQVLGNSR